MRIEVNRMYETIYFWRVTDKFDQIISWGITTSFCEFPLDKISGVNTSADRDLCDVQDYLNKHHLDKNYLFDFEQFQADPEHFFITNDE